LFPTCNRRIVSLNENTFLNRIYKPGTQFLWHADRSVSGVMSPLTKPHVGVGVTTVVGRVVCTQRPGEGHVGILIHQTVILIAVGVLALHSAVIRIVQGRL